MTHMSNPVHGSRLFREPLNDTRSSPMNFLTRKAITSIPFLNLFQNFKMPSSFVWKGWQAFNPLSILSNLNQTAQKSEKVKRERTPKTASSVEQNSVKGTKRHASHKIARAAKETKTVLEKIPNVAQYKDSNWGTQVKRVDGISLDDAKKIANEDDKISYFFYMTGGLYLEKQDGGGRSLSPRTAVFFSGEPWWGDAGGRADGYIKNKI